MSQATLVDNKLLCRNKFQFPIAVVLPALFFPFVFCNLQVTDYLFSHKLIT